MLKKVNLKEQADSLDSLFTYLHVGDLNDHVMHVLKAEDRTLDFQIHEHSDEMFYCIEGRFQIELDDGFVDIEEGDFIVIPKGVRHRPVCKSLVKCLLIERAGTLNKDNTGGAYGG
ncbi:MAG TPA: cupin domain-containing protein [Papillibacter sp.]|nr:cupin domain-containing protein [Papillibacter sp.]